MFKKVLRRILDLVFVSLCDIISTFNDIIKQCIEKLFETIKSFLEYFEIFYLRKMDDRNISSI